MRTPRSRWPWLLFLLALVLRAAHLLTLRDSPFFSILYLDPLVYDEWAQRIAAGQLVGDRPFFLDPLYAYFLAATYATFGHHHGAALAVQGLLGAAVAPLVFVASRRWFDATTARTAGVIAAIYPPSIYYGGLIMKPGLAIALVAFAMWLLSDAVRETRPARHWLVAGAVLGLACLTRGNLLLVMPVLVLWVLLRSPAGDPNGSWLARRRFEAAALSCGLIVVLALPALHNLAAGGEPVLTTANAGANFYIGNNPSNLTGEYERLPFVRANPQHEQIDLKAEASRRTGRPMADREVSAFWFREAWDWIRQRPADWLLLLARKARAFWGAFEIPDNLDYALYREHAPVLRLPIPGFGLLAPLALLGAGAVWRRRGWPRLLLWFVCAYTASVVCFFVFSRFRMVVAPALFVLAGVGGVSLARCWAGMLTGKIRVSRALVTSAVFLALLAGVNLPVRGRPTGRWYRLADTLRLPVQPETSSLAHFNLGVAYAREDGMLEAAERELRQALASALDLSHARTHVELGKVLARQHRNQEAIRTYSEGLAIEPDDWKIHHALGLLWDREGNAGEAAAAYRRALDRAPAHAASAVRLGKSLLTLGRYDQAAGAFRQALAVSPGNREARVGLDTAERAGSR